MEQREGGDWAALPDIAPEEDASPTTRLECDGERFDLRPAECGGTHYTWVSGPNPGYGFSVSPAPADMDQHQANIRSFLSMIDPKTGYIEEG